MRFFAFGNAGSLGDGGAYDIIGIYDELEDAEAAVNNRWETGDGTNKLGWAHIAVDHKGTGPEADQLVVIEVRDRLHDENDGWLLTEEGWRTLFGEAIPA